MLRDFRNHEIKVGDSVVYALRRGSRQWLCEGLVREVNGDHLRVNRIKPPCDRTLTLRSLATVCIVSGTNKALS